MLIEFKINLKLSIICFAIFFRRNVMLFLSFVISFKTAEKGEAN